MKIFWIFFGGLYNKIGRYLGVISMYFKVFFKVKVQSGGLGCLKFLIFLWVNGKCWSRS